MFKVDERERRTGKRVDIQPVTDIPPTERATWAGLRQDVASDPTLRLRELEEFVPAS